MKDKISPALSQIWILDMTVGGLFVGRKRTIKSGGKGWKMRVKGKYDQCTEMFMKVSCQSLLFCIMSY